MIIECTRCQTRAKLPDSKEGAKVRCPECGHVYVAHAGGSRGAARARKEDPTKYFIIGGAVLVFAAIMIIASKSDDPQPGPPTEEVSAKETSGPAVATQGWDAPLVKVARKLHQSSSTFNLASLRGDIDFEAVYAWQHAAAGDEAEGPPGFGMLSGGEQEVYRQEIIDGLTTGEWKDLVAQWVPYDGTIVMETDTDATVRVLCSHVDRDLNLADRWVEWRLLPHGKKWRAASWERWISPEEEKVERKKKDKVAVKTTLSDGSQVIEGVVSEEYVAWHPDTPEEMRTEIMAAINVLCDPEAAAKEMTKARIALENDYRKHAVAGLLLKIAEISPDMGPAGSAISEDFQLTYEQATAIQQCHLTLQMITDWNTSYDVHAAMGTTVERQASGIKQWFGWYQKKYKKFWREAESFEADPFFDDPDFQPRNEKERREFEKARREAEANKNG